MAQEILQGRYQILRELGKGGFGTTFLAIDSELHPQQHYVIKCLRPVIDAVELYPLI